MRRSCGNEECIPICKKKAFTFRSPCLIGKHYKDSVLQQLVRLVNLIKWKAILVALETGKEGKERKVKNDHCSIFSNLSNWKEEA